MLRGGKRPTTGVVVSPSDVSSSTVKPFASFLYIMREIIPTIIIGCSPLPIFINSTINLRNIKYNIPNADALCIYISMSMKGRRYRYANGGFN